MPWQQRRALVSPAGANRDNKGALAGEGGRWGGGGAGVSAGFLTKPSSLPASFAPSASFLCLRLLAPPLPLLHLLVLPASAALRRLFPFRPHSLSTTGGRHSPHSLPLFSPFFCLRLLLRPCPPFIPAVLQDRWKIKSSSGALSTSKRMAGRTGK